MRARERGRGKPLTVKSKLRRLQRTTGGRGRYDKIRLLQSSGLARVDVDLGRFTSSKRQRKGAGISLRVEVS